MLRWNKITFLIFSSVMALEVDIPKITSSFQSNKQDDLKKLSELLEIYHTQLSAEKDPVDLQRDELLLRNLNETNKLTELTEFIVSLNRTILEADTNPLNLDLNKIQLRKEIGDLELRKINIEDAINKMDTQKISIIDLKDVKDREIALITSKLTKLLTENKDIDELIQNDYSYLDLLNGELPYDFDLEDFDIDKETVELEALKKDVILERQKELDEFQVKTRETESLRTKVEANRKERDGYFEFLRFFQNDEKLFEKKISERIEETRRKLSLIEDEVQKRFGVSVLDEKLLVGLKKKLEDEKSKDEAVLKEKTDEISTLERKIKDFESYTEILKEEPVELIESELLRMNEVNKRRMTNMEKIREIEKRIIEISKEMNRNEIACTIGIATGTAGYILYLLLSLL